MTVYEFNNALWTLEQLENECKRLWVIYTRLCFDYPEKDEKVIEAFNSWYEIDTELSYIMTELY